MSMCKRFMAVLGLVAMIGSAGGCLAVAAAAGAGAGVAYVRGNSEGFVEAAPEQVVTAAKAVFDEMDITLTEQEQNPDDRRWQLHGETPTGESVKITVEQRAPEVSKLWVRIGIFGDQQYSRTVFERIKARL